MTFNFDPLVKGMHSIMRHPKNFNMRNWCVLSNRGRTFHVTHVNKEFDGDDCGTVMCFAGHASLFLDPSYLGRTIEESVIEVVTEGVENKYIRRQFVEDLKAIFHWRTLSLSDAFPDYDGPVLPATTSEVTPKDLLILVHLLFEQYDGPVDQLPSL